MPSTIPTTAFDPTKTIIPIKSYISLKKTGASAATVLPVKNCSYEPSIEVTKREVPGADGLLRPDRIVAKSHSQIFKAAVEEIDLMDAANGGTDGSVGMDGGLVAGTAEIFVLDQDDASGKTAVWAGPFSATWRLDGSVSFNSKEVTTVNILIEAQEKVVVKTAATVA